MQFLKSIILPSVGMIGLTVFLIVAYLRESIFLDKILISSFILGVVYLVRVLDSARQENHEKSRNDQ